MLLSYWYMFILTILMAIFLIWGFKKLNFVNLSYRKSSIPYAGGTVVLICVTAGYVVSFILGRLSFFKMSFFSVSMFLIYALGIFYDFYGEKSKKLLFGKVITVEIIEAVIILVISGYIFLFFREEYWFLKGILILIIMHFFNRLEHKPGRTIKAYYLFLLFLILTPLRWTRDLYYISFAVFSALYYFDAYCLTAMGRSGSNLSGFIVGLMITEALSTSFIGITLSVLSLTLIQMFLNRNSFINYIKQSKIVDYLDRILTERRHGENVKSQ